jgi:hypothetical protein
VMVHLGVAQHGSTKRVSPTHDNRGFRGRRRGFLLHLLGGVPMDCRRREQKLSFGTS